MVDENKNLRLNYLEVLEFFHCDMKLRRKNKPPKISVDTLVCEW